MREIYLLDCTLRDGGYINDWHFGKDAIFNIGKKIVMSGIEYFEIGFVRDCEYDADYSLFDGNESAAKMFSPKKSGTKYVGMIDMGRPVSLSRLGKRCNDGFDVFRVIFKKNKIEQAYEYIKELIGYGYEVFAQAVGTDGYSDSEFIELIEKFNSLDIKAFYIVDSFGVIKKKHFMRLLQIADNNLREEIMLGYHSHNNMQQALGNAVAMTEYSFKRDIVIDACVYGMGRGAGNLNLELFSEYMNENFGKNYQIEPMLEIIDEYLNYVYSEHYWGYSLPLYLSAYNNCHPNYAIYFAAKGTLTVKSYNEILKSIPKNERSEFSEKKAEEFYKKYQENFIDDKKAVEELSSVLNGREILLLGSGKSIESDEVIIKKYIAEKNPVVIALNYVPKDIKCDYVISCHMRRYKHIESEKGIKKIITSNLREAESFDYMLNFSSYMSEYNEIMENSGVVCLNFLSHIGVKRAAIAGMDGYDTNNVVNYVNSSLEYDFSVQKQEQRNELLTKEFSRLGKVIDIIFLTKSLYDVSSD